MLGLIHSNGLRKRLFRVSRTLICPREVVHLAHYFQTQRKYQVYKVDVNGFQHQGFEGKSFLKGVFDVKQATYVKILQSIMGSRHRTHELLMEIEH